MDEIFVGEMEVVRQGNDVRWWIKGKGSEVVNKRKAGIPRYSLPAVNSAGFETEASHARRFPKGAVIFLAINTI